MRTAIIVVAFLAFAAWCLSTNRETMGVCVLVIACIIGLDSIDSK